LERLGIGTAHQQRYPNDELDHLIIQESIGSIPDGKRRIDRTHTLGGADWECPWRKS
jgi:hypothetical protein